MSTKYLKRFKTHAEYEAYINSPDKLLPNVSRCEENNDVHYNPRINIIVSAKFNVEDESEPVSLYGCDYGIIGSNLFSKIKIDGEEISISDLEEDDGYYTFKGTGEHIVKYTLSDPISIGDYAFADCYNLISITIPKSVTSIGESAFFGCRGLTNINIPRGVTSIGDYVFNDCYNLTNISVESDNIIYDSRNNCNAIIETSTNTLLYGCQNTIIPNNVTSIGNRAFCSCSGLTSINIPSSVTSIGSGAFCFCRGLTSINIPRGVTSISEYAFQYCSGLTSINIPSGVIGIGNYAFQGCSGLTSINIPSGVTSIGGSAFQYCGGLTSITIPNSVTSIGYYAFNDCSSLTSITIPNSVTSIGNYAFNDCSGLTIISVESGNTVYDSRNNCNAIIKTATNTLLYGCRNTIIPSDVTSIGAGAFDNCSSLTSITIPNSVTSIGYYAFSDCSGLTSIDIPNSVTSIGNYAFNDCSSMTSINIGSGVTRIGSLIFNGCSSLTSITSLCTAAPIIQTDTFRDINTGGTLYVPSGSTGYNVWMETDNYYLGKYNWTKVEQ